jgi:hypothetical protein
MMFPPDKEGRTVGNQHEKIMVIKETKIEIDESLPEKKRQRLEDESGDESEEEHQNSAQKVYEDNKASMHELSETEREVLGMNINAPSFHPAPPNTERQSGEMEPEIEEKRDPDEDEIYRIDGGQRFFPVFSHRPHDPIMQKLNNEQKQTLQEAWEQPVSRQHQCIRMYDPVRALEEESYIRRERIRPVEVQIIKHLLINQIDGIEIHCHIKELLRYFILGIDIKPYDQYDYNMFSYPV